MAVLMPMTWPSMFTNGPPLLPSLIAASGLYHAVERLALRLDGATLRADDAERYGRASLEGQRVAHGDDPIANARIVGVAPLDYGKGVLRLYLEDGDVGDYIAANYLSVVSLAVGQMDADAYYVLNDVIVGDDVAIGADDYAGARALVR